MISCQDTERLLQGTHHDYVARTLKGIIIMLHVIKTAASEFKDYTINVL